MDDSISKTVEDYSILTQGTSLAAV